MLITSIFHFRIFLCNWVGIRDILLLSHVFTSDLQACTGKPEISPAHFKDPWIFLQNKVYGSAAQDTPHLQVSKLQAEDPCPKGKKVKLRSAVQNARLLLSKKLTIRRIINYAGSLLNTRRFTGCFRRGYQESLPQIKPYLSSGCQYQQSK